MQGEGVELSPSMSDVVVKEVEEEVINVANNPDHKSALHLLFNGKRKDYADR